MIDHTRRGTWHFGNRLGRIEILNREKAIMKCPSCRRDFSIAHTLEGDSDFLTAKGGRKGTDSIICGYRDCRFHFYLRDGQITKAEPEDVMREISEGDKPND